MSLDAVAGKGSNGFFVLVDYNIYYKLQPNKFGSGFHVRVYRIAVKYAGACKRTAYEFTPVISKNRCPVTNARQNTLSPSGKPGKKVRLNEALGYEQLCICREPVDHKRCTRRQNSDSYIRLCVSAVVYHDPALSQQLRA